MDLHEWPQIERFHLRGQQRCNFIAMKESIYITKELSTLTIGLRHRHARRLTFWDASEAAVMSF